MAKAKETKGLTPEQRFELFKALFASLVIGAVSEIELGYAIRKAKRGLEMAEKEFTNAK